MAEFSVMVRKQLFMKIKIKKEEANNIKIVVLGFYPIGKTLIIYISDIK